MSSSIHLLNNCQQISIISRANKMDKLAENFSLKELQEMCSRFELPIRGRKIVLAKRILEFLSSEGEDAVDQSITVKSNNPFKVTLNRVKRFIQPSSSRSMMNLSTSCATPNSNGNDATVCIVRSNTTGNLTDCCSKGGNADAPSPSPLPLTPQIPLPSPSPSPLPLQPQIPLPSPLPPDSDNSLEQRQPWQWNYILPLSVRVLRDLPSALGIFGGLFGIYILFRLFCSSNELEMVILKKII